MVQHFPDNVLTALKDAIINVFWKKTDVKALFRRCEVPADLIAGQDWQGYKINIVSPVLDALNSASEGLGPLRRILQEALQYQDGRHLSWLPDSQRRIREAERSLEHLRLLVKDYEATVRSKKEQREARLQQMREAKRGAAFRAKLDEISVRFMSYLGSPKRQERGYALEDLLYDLFELSQVQRVL
jgi:hypothetical protein